MRRPLGAGMRSSRLGRELRHQELLPRQRVTGVLS